MLPSVSGSSPTSSLWHARSAQAAPLTGDVAIVGAGIAGLSAALAFQRSGSVSRVFLIERGGVAQPDAGASIRNAGFLMRGCAENYSECIQTYGREVAKRLWRLSEDNIRAVAEEEGSPHFKCPSCLLATDAEEAAQLKKSVELLRQDGFDVTSGLADDAVSQQLRAANHPTQYALINPNDGVCDPVPVLLHLKAKLDPKIVTILEHHTVTSLLLPRNNPNGKVEIRVSHPSGKRILVSQVLLCMNAYSAQLIPSLSQWVCPVRGQMLALACPASECRLAYAYYVNHGYEYMRRVDEQTVIIGGWRRRHAAQEVGWDDKVTAPVQAGLEKSAEQLLGKRYPVTHRWSGTMGFSPDGLPIACAVPQSMLDSCYCDEPVDAAQKPGANDVDRRVWYCGSFTGHGMSLGYLCSKLTVRAMLTPGATAADELFSFQRFGEKRATMLVHSHL